LQKWDRKGILPAFRSPTNRRYYTHEQYLHYRGLISSEQGLVIAYARVSSPSQKKDLAMQKEALRAYCLEHGIKVDQWVEEIGSALNYKRKGFNHIIEQIELGLVKRLIIGYQDRFVRFGYDWFEQFCERHGTEITVINGEPFSPEEELVRDLIAIVTVFSATAWPTFTQKLDSSGSAWKGHHRCSRRTRSDCIPRLNRRCTLPKLPEPPALCGTGR
jgi:predicted site-specific integrase-resolvase